VKLKDKVTLVTGGGRRIGKAIALAHAREGATVIKRAHIEEIRSAVRDVE
jgi:NAD(P)-dependent dehydrogenase (short-subunit alcohol dehydrogenase family)